MMVELPCRIFAEWHHSWLVETAKGKAWVRKDSAEVEFDGREALLIIDREKAKEKNLI